MTYSALTDQIKTSSQSSTRKSTIDTFLIHHQAGTNDNAVIEAMVSGSRGVSANYTISNEGRITCVVPEERRAWTSGSPYDDGKGAAWDHRAVTVEIENESGAPNWKISDKALNSAARLLQDLRSRYAISNVLGHRDLWNLHRASYATFCPGPNTVAQIVSLAKSGSTPAGGGSTPIPKEEEEEMELIYIRAADGAAVYKEVKGVIGSINLKFFTAAERTHFLNLWGTPEKPRNSRVNISYHDVQLADVQPVLNMFATATQAQVAGLGSSLDSIPAATPTEPGVPLDLAALAKAVNDDAAQRLLE